jgi:hypothetical protein
MPSRGHFPGTERTTISVPFCGTDVTASVPPTKPARSRIFLKPKPRRRRSDLTPSRAIPFPLSLIARVIADRGTPDGRRRKLRGHARFRIGASQLDVEVGPVLKLFAGAFNCGEQTKVALIGWQRVLHPAGLLR